MLLPTLLFALFALLSGLGAYLILAYHRGWGAGLIGAFVTLLFFAVLYAVLIALFRAGGFA